MCFITKELDIQIANKDIFVDKFINDKMVSSVFGYDYSKHDPETRIKLKPERVGDAYQIEQGYHSWPASEDTIYAAVFKIPKGTQYIISDVTGNIISEKIEFVKFKN